MPEAEKGEMKPEKWINPEYFEFTQPEYSAILAKTTKYNDNVGRTIFFKIINERLKKIM
jgi:hypothetical protein